jgi:hypothetical protein
MNLIQIENLRTLIDLQYPHICIYELDFRQFMNIPWEAKRFYPLRTRGGWYEKKGFFHNGKTTVWANLYIKQNHIKIADKEIPTITTGANWTKDFSFEEAGSADVIRRMMKLKAFW